ncbi:FMN reductase [Frankia sp. AiPs1]|uniref:NADPH-dependent FMN reductase n=1 Tax=Frankia sp. AiPa1 TaxID=573492 RepID=UPI00202AEF52|nr:NAD(P)H-dependent oxidoreductase [Frankia sp. AiPa1]MCL9758536.1 NAD(P)H-dependent oxidoreductase [Frankia sp. AiPa1]
MGDSYGTGWSGSGPGEQAGEVDPRTAPEAPHSLPTRISRRASTSAIHPDSASAASSRNPGQSFPGGLEVGSPGSFGELPPAGLDGMPIGGPGVVRTRRRRPMIVGIGGTTQIHSFTQWLLATTLATMAQAGAETMLFGPAELDLPMYAPERPERSAAALRLLAAVEQCDALVIATAAQHGRISGLVSNALDYLDDLHGAPRPHLDGRPVGLIVTASDARAATTTLGALRTTVHSLRGWPTPQGVIYDTSTQPSPTAHPGAVDSEGRLSDQATATALENLVDQIMGFTYAWSQVI